MSVGSSWAIGNLPRKWEVVKCALMFACLAVDRPNAGLSPARPSATRQVCRVRWAIFPNGSEQPHRMWHTAESKAQGTRMSNSKKTGFTVNSSNAHLTPTNSRSRNGALGGTTTGGATGRGNVSGSKGTNTGGVSGNAQNANGRSVTIANANSRRKGAARVTSAGRVSGVDDVAGNRKQKVSWTNPFNNTAFTGYWNTPGTYAFSPATFNGTGAKAGTRTTASGKTASANSSSSTGKNNKKNNIDNSPRVSSKSKTKGTTNTTTKPSAKTTTRVGAGYFKLARAAVNFKPAGFSNSSGIPTTTRAKATNGTGGANKTGSVISPRTTSKTTSRTKFKTTASTTTRATIGTQANSVTGTNTVKAGASKAGNFQTGNFKTGNLKTGNFRTGTFTNTGSKARTGGRSPTTPGTSTVRSSTRKAA